MTNAGPKGQAHPEHFPSPSGDAGDLQPLGTAPFDTLKPHIPKAHETGALSTEGVNDLLDAAPPEAIDELVDKAKLPPTEKGPDAS